ncbi:cytochrome b561 domain-containing protein 1-like [Bradysia coprophila]|uniref:cytochrome b561 domain-containing protein 1-like n=1 Tax=Bradysia coprophila TaxID=38358 RepID=UPI00187DCBFF|nr:cytochrome b561 domain-containing protein 1-like [Bradysia coprophila]
MQIETAQKLEFYLNSLNHILIGAVSLYVTWYCYHFGISAYTMHVWLSILAYQLFMAEAILALYSTNSWSFFHALKTKRNIHWIIQIFATLFAIVGTICVYWGRPTHFMTVHSVTGLISLILVVIVAINGLPALWSFEFGKWSRIHPVYLKLFHNLIGIFAFIIGMVSLYYGYLYTYFVESDEKDISPWLIGVLFVTTIFSLFGALKSLRTQCQTAHRLGFRLFNEQNRDYQAQLKNKESFS